MSEFLHFLNVNGGAVFFSLLGLAVVITEVRNTIKDARRKGWHEGRAFERRA